MEKKTRPGEKVFPFILLAISVFVIKESWGMYQNAPELQGYGTVPLICGVLLFLLTIINIINNFRLKSELAGQPAGDKVKAVIHHLFSRDVVVTMLCIIAYCLMIYAGVMFEAATIIFLWGTMIYLHHGEGKKSVVKNLIYSIIILLFVILVFHIGFRVVLP